MNNGSYTVGWVAEARWPYRNIQASTRIRCLDIINFLNNNGIRSGLLKPFNKYDLLVFQKTFTQKHYELAKRSMSYGSKIILDINVNYFEKTGDTTQVTQKHIKDLHRFLELTDVILVSSPYLKEVALKYHPDVHYIPEYISTIGTYPPKVPANPYKLLYCGYAIKADSVLLIDDVIRKLAENYEIECMFVCDKNPRLTLPVKTSFIKYRQNNLAAILRKGDIKIAPRKLDNTYDLGHSFTKIGYPMSVGLPVVASPVPSYKGSPALIADSKHEWIDHISTLINKPSEYSRLSEEGVGFVRENYSLDKIGRMYLDLFKRAVHA